MDLSLLQIFLVLEISLCLYEYLLQVGITNIKLKNVTLKYIKQKVIYFHTIKFKK